MKKQSFFLFLFSLIIIVLAFYYRQQLEQFKSFGLFGIFLINLLGSATIFLPAPAIATVFAGGFLYPPFLVALFAALGSSIGEMTGYMLGHSGKRIFFGEKNHFLYQILNRLFKKYGGLVIVVVSFIPNPFFDAVGIIAGAFSYSPYRFFVYLLVGRLIRDLLLAYIGSSIY